MKVKLITLFCIIGVLLSGCASNVQQIPIQTEITQTVQQTEVPVDNSKILEEIQSSNDFTIKMAFMSMVKTYNVFINDSQIGTITGKFFNMTGDVFTFSDISGNELGKEKQIKRWGVKLNRMAEIFDNKDNTIGYIGEEKINDLFQYGYRFHFYDVDKNEIAYTKDIMFTLMPKYEIYNTKDELICTIQKELAMTNSYSLKIENTNSIQKEYFIYFTCILDSIKTADDKVKSKHDKKKN